MKNRVALVTGSSGFVGRHMVEYLRNLGGWDVWECDSFKDEVNLNSAVELFTDDAEVFDLVIHAAALNPHRAAIDSEPYNLPYNLLLDSALFEWAIRTRQHHVVYLSSSAAYPVTLQRIDHHTPLKEEYIDVMKFVTSYAPDAHYGWTKLTGERMAAAARECGVPVTVVRPFSGYGSDQSENFPFRAFIERARRREDPFTIWGSARQVRDWIHIDDIVAAIYALYEADAQSQHHAVNLCTGQDTAMGHLAQMIIDAVGGGYKPVLAIDESAPMGVHYRVGDPTLLEQFYVPRVPLDEGVLRALRGE